MAKMGILLAVIALCLVPTMVGADLNPNVPLVQFEMSVRRLYVINDAPAKVDILSFHQSSQNWMLYLENDIFDDYPYDNLTLNIACDGQSVSVDTTDYDEWVDNGTLSITFPYGDDVYQISYNDVTFGASRSDCELSVSDYGASSYVNNTYDYTVIEMQLLPLLSTVEFVNCSYADTDEIGIINELSSIATILSDFWEIAWLVYSIFIIIFAVFMIPIFIFILIRWALYRLTGYKLVERREGGSVS